MKRTIFALVLTLGLVAPSWANTLYSGFIPWKACSSGQTLTYNATTGNWDTCATPFATGNETDPVVKAITGIVKSNGSVISAAVAGTDYQAPSALTNILTNSGFKIWSNGTLENVGTQITVTDITAGVCTTTATQGLSVGKLVKFGAGGTTANKTYKVAAVIADTSFTISDTSITDATDVTCYEVTPGTVAADTLGPEGWNKVSGVKVWREYPGTNTKGGSFYALGVTGSVGSGIVSWSGGAQSTVASFYKTFAGRPVVMGAWVMSSAASKSRVCITDSSGSTCSSYHTGGGAYEWLEATRTPSASITSFNVSLDAGTSTTAYFSQPMLSFGTVIGSGNYQPKWGETIALEAATSSTALNSMASASNVSPTALDIEVDSQGKIGAGVANVSFLARITDSGSASTACSLSLGTGNYNYYINSAYGLTNSAPSSHTGTIFLSNSPTVDNFYYTIAASGAGTFGIPTFRYNAVQLP